MSDEATPIGLGRALRVYLRMHLLRLGRGRLKWAVLALLLLPVAGAGAALPFDRAPFDNLLELYLRFLLPFLPALIASPVVAEEIEGRTFTFLFARPAPRAALVLGKFVAIAAPLAAGIVLSLLLTFLVGSLRGTGEDFLAGLPQLGRVVGVSLLGIAAFTALAALCGAWFTRHPFMAAVGYLLMFEWMFGFVPLLKLATVTWHLRRLADVHPEPVFFQGDLAVPLWVSALVPATLCGLALLGAAAAVASSEYRADS